MKRRYILLAVILTVILLIILLCAGFRLAKFVLLSSKDVTVTLKDATISETQIKESPSYWTNDKVIVTIETEKGGQIYYKVGESGTWTKYSSTFEVTENGKVYAKLVYKDGEGPETIKEITNIVHPNEEVASTTTSEYTVIFDSVQAAIDAAGTDEATVTLLKNEIEESVTIKENQNITLNVNGKTLTGKEGSTITNNGTLKISGTSGTITGSKADTILNKGTLIKDTETEISNTATADYYVINNSGTTTISAGTINASKRGIYNDTLGKLTVSGGTLTAEGNLIRNYGTANTEDSPAVEISGNPTLMSNNGNVINNQKSGGICINGGTLDVIGTTASTPTVLNLAEGKILITAGTIKCSGTNAAVFNGYSGGNSQGTIEIRGGTIQSDTAVGVRNNEKGNIIISAGTITTKTNRTIENGQSGTVEIRGGELTSTGSLAVYNLGTIKISGGTIKTINNNDTIFNPGTAGKIEITGGEVISEVRAAISMGNGTLEMTGGTLTGKTYGIWASDSNQATITVGKDDSSVSISNPSIIGNTATGIYVGAGILNFYDGQIKGPTGKSITGTVANVARSCVIVKTDDGTTETSVLGPSAPVVTDKLNNASGASYTSGTWTNQNVYVTLASSNIGAGIKRYEWYENGAWTTRALTTSNNVGTITYTVTRNETIRYRAIDNNGVISEESSIVIKIDKIKPKALINTESMYITDGLVTRLDGVNNSNGSHSGSTTTWKDISGNSKNGTITGGTWGANYLDFNGTSSWVNLGVMNSNYQTIEVTFSPDVVPTSSKSVIGNWEAGGGGIYINANGYIVGEYYVGGYKTITSRVKVIAGNKYHAAITYNGTTVILYVNGVEQGRISASGTIGAPANSTVMALGANPKGTEIQNSYFDGKIFTAAVYNKALTESQIKTNADAGKALAGGPTNASSITYTIRFSKEVSEFTTDDIAITNGIKGNLSTVTSGKLFRIVATTSTNQNNTQTIALNQNGFSDIAGNKIDATSKTVIIDRVAPTVTVSANGGTYNITPRKYKCIYKYNTNC